MIRLTSSFCAICWLVLALAAGSEAHAQTATLAASSTTFAPAGGTITFTFSATFSGTAVVVLNVVAPAGWAYQPGTGEPSVKPNSGDTLGHIGSFDWANINPVSSPVSFTFVLTYPPGTTSGLVTSSAFLRPTGDASSKLQLAEIYLGAGVGPRITAQPVGQSAVAGATVSLSAQATGTPPLSYQWIKGPAPIAGATTATLTLPNVQLADAGIYALSISNSFGSTTSNAVALTTRSVPTTKLPASVAVSLGEDASFEVVASGSPPLSYQWNKDGAVIVGATTSVLTLISVQSNQAGRYTVTVSDADGSVTSESATLTVRSVPRVPLLLLHHPPDSSEVIPGSTASFSASALGQGPVRYQWLKGTVPVAGATTGTLTLRDVQLADAGTYTLAVSDSLRTVTSNPFTLTVLVAPTITRHPAAVTTKAGSEANFEVVGSGTPPLSYQWKKDGALIPGATTAALKLTAVQISQGGSYAVNVSNRAGSINSDGVMLTVSYSRIANLSVRANLDNSQTLIVGLVTSGRHPILARAIGPGMVPFGITSGFVADPRMTLVSQVSGVTVNQNDDWSPGLAATFASLGAFALTPGSKDAGLLQPVEGPHTIQVSGGGLVLVEVYDAESAGPIRLTNVSARNQVGTGENVLIAGFVIEGNDKRLVLIRGIGPALRENFGVSGALIDPKLEIFRQGNTKFEENDDWSGTLRPIFDQVGAFALRAGSKDAAMIVLLEPGAYTAQLSGVGGATGDGLIEVYEVP